MRHCRGWRRTRSGRAAGPPGPVAGHRAARPPRCPAGPGWRRTRRPGTWPAPRPAPASARRSGSRVSAADRSRNAAAADSPPRACARPADRSSSHATSSSGPDVRLGAVPGPPIGVGLGIGRAGQRLVHGPPVRRRRGPVHRRPHQRMPEHHPLPDRQQPGVRRRRQQPRPRSRAAPPPATPAPARQPAPPPRPASAAE